MKFARVDIPWRTKPVILTRLLDLHEMNFLQLDFRLPTSWPACKESNHFIDETLADELLNQMKVVHKWLFLRPDLVMVTNAGGSRLVGCMETLARFLMDHGSDDMPIAAVRGTNLLATVDPWLPPEVVNSNRKVLAAQVEIGGGPLATALAEGARIVVAGAYDRAAPFLAASVASGKAHWNDFDKLAAVAMVSEISGVAIELCGGGVEVELGSSPEIAMRQKLQYADVFVDASQFVSNATARGTWQVEGVTGEAADSLWNLRISLDAGFRGVALIEEHAGPVREFCENIDLAGVRAHVDEFVSVNLKDHVISRVTLHGDSFSQCRQRLELLESWVSQTGRKLGEPAASIHQLTESVAVRIPSDQVTLSVDTRPAREWL